MVGPQGRPEPVSGTSTKVFVPSVGAGRRGRCSGCSFPAGSRGRNSQLPRCCPSWLPWASAAPGKRGSQACCSATPGAAGRGLGEWAEPLTASPRASHPTEPSLEGHSPLLTQPDIFQESAPILLGPGVGWPCLASLPGPQAQAGFSHLPGYLALLLAPKVPPPTQDQLQQGCGPAGHLPGHGPAAAAGRG